MDIIYKDRQTGKTTALIKKCATEGGYIVCFSKHEAQRVFNAAKKLGLSIPFPISFKNFILGEYGRHGVKKVYIDNIDVCLQKLSNVSIEAMSLSKLISNHKPTER